MIDDKVIALPALLQTFWNNEFNEHPKYTLDLTWPSLGILDKLLLPLRFKEDIEPKDLKLITTVAAYLGGIIYGVWEAFPDNTKVSLRYFGKKDTPQIILRARGGQYLSKDSTYEIDLVDTLIKTILKPPNPFPIFQEFAANIDKNDNLLSPLARGIACGRSPYGEGGWLDVPFKKLGGHIRVAEIKLSLSCAKYYKKAFPGEPLGAMPQIYQQQLILPPLGFNENSRGSLATVGLTRYLVKNNIPEKDMKKLALNLAQSPDDVISSAGFALAAATCEDNPPTRYHTIVEMLGEKALLLKPAYLEAREILNKQTHWLKSTFEKDYSKATEGMKKERNLGLLPLFRLAPDKFEENMLIPIATTLCFLDYPLTLHLLSLLLEEIPLDIDLILQKMTLDLPMKNIESLQKDLDSLSDTPAIKDGSSAILYHEIKGITAIQTEHYDSAIASLDFARKHTRDEIHRYTMISNQLIWTLIIEQQYERALTITDEMLSINPGSVLGMLNRRHILSTLGRDIEAKEQFEKLMRIAPLDQRVFQEAVDLLLIKAQSETEQESH